LENRGSENNEMSERVWQIVKASTRKIGVGETERRGSKESREEKVRKGQEEKTEKGEDDGSKEDSKGMGDIG